MSFAPVYYPGNLNSSETSLIKTTSRRNNIEDLTSKYNRSSETSNKYISTRKSRFSLSSENTDLSSFSAPNISEMQNIMHLKILTELGSTMESIGKFFVRFDAFLLALVNDYVTGRIDIPDLVREFGGDWTESSVVLLLEKIGAHRHISLSLLSEEDELTVLRKLANIRSSHLYETYNEESWIKREVIATQRIESIYVSSEDIAE